MADSFMSKRDFIVAIKSQHYLLTIFPIKLHRVLSKLYLTNSSNSPILITSIRISLKPITRKTQKIA